MNNLKFQCICPSILALILKWFCNGYINTQPKLYLLFFGWCILVRSCYPTFNPIARKCVFSFPLLECVYSVAFVKAASCAHVFLYLHAYKLTVTYFALLQFYMNFCAKLGNIIWRPAGTMPNSNLLKQMTL